MFWGLIMEPQRRYSQKVKKSFHVSMAALDITTCTDNEPTQVICSFDNRNYLLCTLQKDKAIQVSLDLNFEVDDTVCFATNGKANIHLTGYLTDEFGDLDDTGDLNDTVDSDDTSDSIDAEETEGKATSRKRQSVENNTSPLKKKPKTLELLAAVDSQKEDTDSDDSDYDLSNALNEEGSEDEDMDTTQAEEEEGGEEEDDEKEEDDDAEEEESENEEEESGDDGEEASSLSDNEEVEKPKIAKVNGVPKKEGQKQKQSKKEVLETPVSQKEKKPKTPKSEKAQQQQQQKSEKTPKETDKTTGKASKLAKDESKTPGQTAKSPPQSPAQKRTIEGGVVIEDLKLGNGPIAKTGRVVQVYYEGRFKNNKKMFDSTIKGPGFKFRLGRQEVIKGWDVGVIGMKVGGKRRIICPPNMAYGQKGSPPAIPPNSTLVFEVELKNVN